MKIQFLTCLACVSVLAGCGGDESRNNTSVAAPDQAVAGAAKTTRGGTITIGEQTWKIVPSIQCGVYPGGVVSIAGHAASDPDLEIVIDHDPNGLIGVHVGGESGNSGWYSARDSLQFSIEGKSVSGSGTFGTRYGGSGDTAQGTWVINC